MLLTLINKVVFMFLFVFLSFIDRTHITVVLGRDGPVSGSGAAHLRRYGVDRTCGENSPVTTLLTTPCSVRCRRVTRTHRAAGHAAPPSPSEQRLFSSSSPDLNHLELFTERIRLPLLPTGNHGDGQTNC